MSQETNKSNIAIVDDDPRICRLYRRILESAGYNVFAAKNEEELLQTLAKTDIHLIFLDLQLPDKHGLDILRDLNKKPEIGVIILTGTGDRIDEIVSLESGADAFLLKPFGARELLARVRSILRRLRVDDSAPPKAEGTALFFGEWTLDTSTHTLKTLNGKEVKLTSTEFSLLLVFLHSSNNVLSRDQLLDHISGSKWSPMDRSIDVLISRLRKKIELNSEKPMYIKTIRGVGYKFTSIVRS